MSIPTLHPAMRALVDQHVAAVRDLLDEHPQYRVYLRAGYGSRETVRLVADDCLGLLGELADAPKADQLRAVAARLYAYLEVAR